MPESSKASWARIMAPLSGGKGVLALGLSIPTGDTGEAVGDVLNLDVERGRIEQVETASGQHALPGARRLFLIAWLHGAFPPVDLLIGLSGAR